MQIAYYYYHYYYYFGNEVVTIFHLKGLCLGNENISDVATYRISACWESSVAIYDKNKTQEN